MDLTVRSSLPRCVGCSPGASSSYIHAGFSCLGLASQHIWCSICPVHGIKELLTGQPPTVVGGTARFNEKQRALFLQHYFPWATKAGLKCTDLMSVYYEKHSQKDLEEVRRNWGIIPYPDHRKSSV
ncbi:hypothetical protein GUJ93_ZPchr0004g38930 [Zizania palustris]|uniref:Uncharacterized protein n=1 Tax=Zizania palustris TaxID=103762 RepID=A0A8J5S7Y1_ZIZPA|nr:hypothetical protein GUJ93_ZPchr0004g38930 [Zizania palustris]